MLFKSMYTTKYSFDNLTAFVIMLADLWHGKSQVIIIIIINSNNFNITVRQ